jgi:hypothetical protein
MRFSHSVVGRGSGSVGTGLAARQADRDGQIGVDRGDRRHRQRIEDPAVGEQSPVHDMRRDDPGDGNRRPDGLVERPPLQPHRLAGQQVGRDRGVGERQLLDGGRAEDIAHCVEDFFGSQHTRRADRRIQQPQDGALSQ